MDRKHGRPRRYRENYKSRKNGEISMKTYKITYSVKTSGKTFTAEIKAESLREAMAEIEYDLEMPIKFIRNMETA